jgi:hypothetical protein
MTHTGMCMQSLLLLTFVTTSDSSIFIIIGPALTAARTSLCLEIEFRLTKVQKVKKMSRGNIHYVGSGLLIVGK